MTLRLGQLSLLVECLKGGRLRNGIGHFAIGSDASEGCGTAFALDVGLLGEPRFTEMHMRVDDAWQNKSPRGVDHTVVRATGLWVIVMSDDVGNTVVGDNDRTFAASAVADDGAVLNQYSHGSSIHFTGVASWLGVGAGVTGGC